MDGTTVGAKQGQNLAGLFNLTGVTNREDDEVDEAQMAAWVKQAAALPGWG